MVWLHGGRPALKWRTSGTSTWRSTVRISFRRRRGRRFWGVPLPDPRDAQRRPWSESAPQVNHLAVGGMLLEDAHPCAGPGERIGFRILCWYGREGTTSGSVEIVVSQGATAPPMDQLTEGTWVLVGGELVGGHVEACVVVAEIIERGSADGWEPCL